MGIDLDEYRERSRATWDEMAAGWEARSEWVNTISAAVNEWIVQRAELQPCQVVLDLAAGPGELSFQAAARVGDRGRVLCTDFSPEMVAAARRGGEGRGLGNVEYRVLDAERMDLGDDSADAVLCRWGYMLMGDPAAALGETRRVLRDGGRLAFAVWAAPDRNPWAALPALVLVERGHMPPPEPGAPGIFAMADPERIRALLSGAGFSDPQLEEIPFEFLYSDFEDVWDSLVRLAGPLAEAIKRLPDAEREATRAAIEEKLEPFRQPDGTYVAPALCIAALSG